MSSEGELRPERVARFANYFKNYMGLSAIVTAALPIPVTSFDIIPMFEVQRRMFSAYTSLFCFLLLSYVFYMRHPLARVLFSRRRVSQLLPLIGVVGAVLFFTIYHITLDAAVASIKSEYTFSSAAKPATADILAKRTFDLIPNGLLLTASYVAAFVCAEFAFVIMATREYMQDVLKIADADLYARHDASFGPSSQQPE